MNKEYIHVLLSMLNEERDKNAILAEKSIIKELEPILKQWYRAVRKHGKRSISANGEYTDENGEITNIKYSKYENSITFHYTDIRGDYLVYDRIDVSLNELLSDGFIEKKESEAWMEEYDRTMRDIELQKASLLKMQCHLAQLMKDKPKNI